MSKIEEVLIKAINGESNAIKKYKKFQEIAQKENLPNVAYLFKALIAGEGIHVSNHTRALGREIDIDYHEFVEGITSANLEAAIEGETYEFKSMYPGFLKEIKKEKNYDAEVTKLSLKWAMGVEINHAAALKKAFEALSSGKDIYIEKLWVCRACGNLYIGDQPTEICPVCKHDKIFYKEVKR